MLGEHLVTPVLLAADLTAAGEFYRDKIGVEILHENDPASLLEYQA